MLGIQLILCIVAPVYSGTTGIITGTITDSQTSQKLTGVNIVIDGTDLTTVTDANGYYVITNVPPGDHKVTASLVGYADAQVEKVSIMMDVTTKVDIAMKQAVAEEEEVVVTQARPVVQRDVTPTMYVVDKKQEALVKSQPNLLYQASGIVKTQPGIVLDANSSIHIRGGRADEVGWTIDGIPVLDPVSNGFGTNLVTIGMDKMEVYTGGYRPEYGNAVSGVLNEVVKTGRTSPGTSVQLLAGSQSFQGIYPEIGGYSDKGWDYYVGSYLWRSDLKDILFNHVDSADTIGKFNYSLGSKDKLTLLLNQGSEKYTLPSYHTQTFTNGKLVDIPLTEDTQNQRYGLSALTLTHKVDAKSFFTLSPYVFVSKTRLDAIAMNGGYGWWSNSSSDTTGFKTDYTNQLSPKQLLKVGGIIMSSKNRYEAIVPYMKDYFDGLGDYAYTANADTLQTGIYAQDQILMGEKWAMELGLRYDRMKYKKVENPDTTDSQISPRFGTTYVVDPKTMLKFSAGKMIQFPRSQVVERIYTDPGWINEFGLNNANVKSERCTQYDLGWERHVDGDLSVVVTPFYRKFTDMLQSEPIDPSNPYGASTFVNLGEGNSKGVELQLKKNLSRNWSGWLSYTYMKTKAQASDDGSSVTPGVTNYVNWDQRHTIQLVLSYVRNGWTYNLNGEYGSGFPYGDTNEKRISSHTVFDVNISRRIKDNLLGEGSLNFSIANIFNVHNVLAGSQAPIYDDNGDTIGSKFEATDRISPRAVSLSYTKKL